jgi:hypothetical protein
VNIKFSNWATSSWKKTARSEIAKLIFKIFGNINEAKDNTVLFLVCIPGSLSGEWHWIPVNTSSFLSQLGNALNPPHNTLLFYGQAASPKVTIVMSVSCKASC